MHDAPGEKVLLESPTSSITRILQPLSWVESNGLRGTHTASGSPGSAVSSIAVSRRLTENLSSRLELHPL